MKLWNRARKFAIMKGLEPWSEDFASEYILRKLSGIGTKQTLVQYYKDYLSRITAKKRHFDNPRFQCAGIYRVAAPQVRESRIDTHKLNAREKRIVDLYLKGYTMKQIGSRFKRSESCVSNWLKDIGRKLK